MDNNLLKAEPVDEASGGLKTGFLQRVWKYKFHYFIVAIPVLLILLFKIFPLIGSILISFQRFDITKGFVGSDWVGLENYQRLFGLDGFRSAFTNSIVLKLGYVFAVGVVSVILALALSCIRVKFARKFFTTLFLIPYFIPGLVFAYIVMVLFSVSENPIFRFEGIFPLGETGSFRLIFLAAEVVKTCGIPVILALGAINVKMARYGDGENSIAHTSFVGMKVAPVLKAVLGFCLIQLSVLMASDFEMLFRLYNVRVYEVADTLDTFAYRISYNSGQFDIGEAVGVIKFGIQLITTAGIYFVMKKFLIRDLFGKTTEKTSSAVTRNLGENLAGFIPAVIYSAILLLPLYILFIYPFVNDKAKGIGLGELMSKTGMGGSFLPYLIVTFFGAVISCVFSVLLAYPLTARDIPGRSIYKGFLLLTLTAGTTVTSGYLFYYYMGMLDTKFPYLINGFYTVMNVLVIKSIFNSRYGDLREAAAREGKGEAMIFLTLYLPKILKPLVALTIFQFVAMWGSYQDSMIYMSRPDNYSPVACLLNIFNGMGPENIAKQFGYGAVMKLGFIASLPPIVLFLAFIKFFTPETFMSQTRK